MESTWKIEIQLAGKKAGGRNGSKVNIKRLPWFVGYPTQPFWPYRLLCNVGPLVLLRGRSRYTFFLLALIVRRAEPLKEGTKKDVTTRTYVRTVNKPP